MKQKLIFALDVSNYLDAQRYVDQLADHVGLFKVGLELFMAAGSAIMRTTPARIMLDLKLHDIPETVERAVTRAGELGAKFATLHVQQKETLRRAVSAAEKTGLQLLAVTLLTSMTEQDLRDLGMQGGSAFGVPAFRPDERVLDMAKFAWEQGLTGFVASPKEVAMLRKTLPKAILVIPGIRPAGAALGDQKRVGTPEDAIRAGADYLVVGRPIRDAPDPVVAANSIAREIELASS